MRKAKRSNKPQSRAQNIHMLQPRHGQGWSGVYMFGVVQLGCTASASGSDEEACMSRKVTTCVAEEAGKVCGALPAEQTLRRRLANACKRIELRRVLSQLLYLCACFRVCVCGVRVFESALARKF